MALRTGLERGRCSPRCFASPAVSYGFRVAFPLHTLHFEFDLFQYHCRFPYPIEGHGGGPSPESGAGHPRYRLPGNALEETVPGKYAVVVCRSDIRNDTTITPTVWGGVTDAMFEPPAWPATICNWLMPFYTVA